MDDHSLNDVAADIADAGYFHTRMVSDLGTELLVAASAEMPGGGGVTGNSFKVFRNEAGWHVETWAPVTYIVPPDASLSVIVMTLLESTDRIVSAFDAAVVNALGLRRVPSR